MPCLTTNHIEEGPPPPLSDTQTHTHTQSVRAYLRAPTASLTITAKPRDPRINDLQCLLTLGRRRQVLVPVLGDQDAVLDAHAANVPVLV